jgi:biotin synthase-related radical SAM superfamily protein
MEQKMTTEESIKEELAFLNDLAKVLGKLEVSIDTTDYYFTARNMIINRIQKLNLNYVKNLKLYD